jgi:hypothetical protein
MPDHPILAKPDCAVLNNFAARAWLGGSICLDHFVILVFPILTLI